MKNQTKTNNINSVYVMKFNMKQIRFRIFIYILMELKLSYYSDNVMWFNYKFDYKYYFLEFNFR